MAATFDTYYINASTFNDATIIYTDATLTTVAPDGVYQFNGIHRTLTSGVLGSIFFCDTCCAGCSSTYMYPIPNAKNQYHQVCSNVGDSTDTAIIVKFKFTGVPIGYPLGFSAEFNNVSSQGVVSNRFGWLPNKYVGDITHIGGLSSNFEGTYSLNGFAWQPLTSSFVSTSSVTEVVTATDMSLTTNNPDECYLLIPKINSAQTVNADVYHPIPPATFPNAGGCDITIPCPTTLHRFAGTDTALTSTAACALATASGIPNKYNLMRVNSVSGPPRVFDRVFVGSSGSTPVTAAGYYGILNEYAGTTETYSWIRIDSDGIVQAAGSCGATMLTEMISSVMLPTSTEACNYQNQSGVNLPDQQYWHNGSNDAPVLGNAVYSDVLGTTVLPDGWYQLLREYKLIRVAAGQVAQESTC
tara:strand:- start:336 stop:1577 length:1242 start_codon:yes stop_codon:yes gene_type:complete